jgi:hypothetical protein
MVKTKLDSKYLFGFIIAFLISLITVYLYFSMNSVDYFSSDCKVDSDCATNKCNKKTGKCE